MPNNFKIIYKILSILEKAMSYDEFDPDRISYQKLDISKALWIGVMMMFEYSICNQADEEIFKRQCNELEKKFSELLVKDNFLTDVDGSKIQTYTLNGKKVKVVMSNYENEVYIYSEIDLKEYFN